MRTIWWLAAVGAISVFTIALSEQRALDPVQNLSLSISAPAESAIRNVASPLNDIYQGIAGRGDIARENRRLQEELERLRQQLAGQQDAEQRVRELSDALGVKQSLPGEQLVVANVIAQDPSGLKRMIAIDLGLNDGIDEGMVILSRGGSVVGTVSRAYGGFAWVRLVTDPDSAVNAQVNLTLPAETPAPSPSAQPSPAPGGATPAPTPSPTPRQDPFARGVAEGDARRGLMLKMLPTGSPVAAGDLVVTSGLGGNYPPSLLIGAVESVEERPQAPFKRATVEPAATLSNLDTVLVLVSFTPARLTPP